VLIIPSSWGSQLVGDLYINTGAISVPAKLGGGDEPKASGRQRRGSAREDPGEQRLVSPAWRARRSSLAAAGAKEDGGVGGPDLDHLRLDLGLLGPDLGPVRRALEWVLDRGVPWCSRRSLVAASWAGLEEEDGLQLSAMWGVRVLRLCDYNGEMLW
jgi:hypothetical protein